MRAPLPLFVLPLVLAGCTAHRPPVDPHTISQTTASGEVEGRPTLGRAIPIPGQPVALVPFAIESRKGLFESDDPYRRASADRYDSYGYSAQKVAASIAPQSPGFGGEVRWHNALFRDLKTGEEWTLLDRRGVIGRWQAILIQPQRDGPWVSRAMLFIAVLDDTNHDGLLDNLDARTAILTDADGRHARIISPPATQVWNASYDAEKDTVFLQVVADTNHDGTFDFEDSPVPYMLPASGAGPAVRVVSEATVARVESVLGPISTTKSEPTPAKE